MYMFGILGKSFKDMMCFTAGQVMDSCIQIPCKLLSKDYKNEVKIDAKLDREFFHGIKLNSKLAATLSIDLNKGKSVIVMTNEGPQLRTVFPTQTIIVDMKIRLLNPKCDEDFQEFSYYATSGPVEICDSLSDNTVLLGVLFLECNGFDYHEKSSEMKDSHIVIYVHPIDFIKLKEFH